MKASGENKVKRGILIAITATLSAQVQGALAHLTLAVLASEAAPSYGLAPDLIGIYSGLIFLACAIGSLGAAGLNPRYGAIRVTQISIGCSAAGLALLFVPHWLALLPSALLVGAGYGPLTVASSHILARAAPPRMMALIFSIKQTGVPIGYALAGSLLPPLALAFGWRVAVGVVVGLSLALIAALEAARPRLDADRTGTGSFAFSVRALAAPLGLVWATPGLRRLAIASLVFAGTQISIASFLVVYMQGAAGLDLQRAGLVLSVANLVAIAGRVGWGIVADWIGRGQTIIAGLGLGMAGAIALSLLVSPAWPYAALLAVGTLIGLTVLSWNGVFVAETARQAPAGKVSQAAGGVFTVTYCGMVVAPSALTGLFSLFDSYAGGFLFLTVVVAAVSVTFLARPLVETQPAHNRHT